MYYVYEWIIDDTNEVFYVGKGILSRTTELTGRNKRFLHIVSTNKCSSRIVKCFTDEDAAYQYEIERIEYWKNKGQASANIAMGGRFGNTLKYMTDEELLQFKTKVGRKTLETNQDEQYFEKWKQKMSDINKQPEHRKKVSESTKKAMWDVDIRKRFMEARCVPVRLIFDETDITFEVLQHCIDYCSEKFNISQRLVRKILESEQPYIAKRKTHKHINGLIIKRLSDESVETKGDECNPVELEIDTNSKCEALK